MHKKIKRRPTKVRLSIARVRDTLRERSNQNLLQTGLLRIPAPYQGLPQTANTLSLLSARMHVLNICPVCGNKLPFAAMDHNICPCCGVEFGYDDSGVSHQELREIWIENGMQWWSPSNLQPAGWSPVIQLREAFGYNQSRPRISNNAPYYIQSVISSSEVAYA